MTSLFGVQSVFKTDSKHYKSTVNSFLKKRVLVSPKRDQDVFTQDVCVNPKAFQIENVKSFAFSFRNVMNTSPNPCMGMF